MVTSNKDDTGHDNTYYEDKFAILWDINSDGFAEKDVMSPVTVPMMEK
ncbi:hypothetical protein [Psychromonas hadalis]